MMSKGWSDKMEKTDLVEGMATLGDDVGFLAWEPKTETEGLKADWTFVVVIWGGVI